MTLRVEISGTQTTTYTQAWNAENRLSVVTNTVTGAVTRFVYDGDGNLVKQVKPDGTATLYIGAAYEVEVNTGGAITRRTSYHAAVGARVMRVDSTLYYVLTDHLGSASVTLDASGNVVGEQRYYAFGETRLTTGSMRTDRLFTGQREMAGLGLYHFGARFYSPLLARFISADTLVPEAGNPQDLNRYAYVRNAPLNYTAYPASAEASAHADPNTAARTATCELSGTIGGGGWYRSEVTVTLVATDDLAGVVLTQYRLDDAPSWSDYAAPFTVGDEGATVVHFRSIDQVWNVEETKAVTIAIDFTPPTTTHQLEGAPGLNGWYITPVTVTLAANDAHSGIALTTYRLDSGGQLSYTIPVIVEAEGSHTLEYRSSDVAGNEEGIKRVCFISVGVVAVENCQRIQGTD